MPVRAYYDKRHSVAISLGEVEMKELYAFLSSRFPEMTILTVCKDELQRNFDSLQELLSYHNSEQKRIVSITLIGRNTQSYQDVKLRFYAESDDNISLELHGEEGTVDAVKNFVMGKLETYKPWYAPISIFHHKFFTFFPFILIGVILGQMGIWFLEYAPKLGGDKIHWPTRGDVEFTVIGNFVAFVALAILWFCWKWMDAAIARVFPMISFLIGAEIRKDKNLEVYRTVFIASFVVSVAAGVLVLIFT